jgi:hypothetical protein
MPIDDLELSLLKEQRYASQTVFASSGVQERRYTVGLPSVQPANKGINNLKLVPNNPPVTGNTRSLGLRNGAQSTSISPQWGNYEVNRIHLAGRTEVTVITLLEGGVVACFSFNLSM